jgi:RimJ/RimL family protein N-acetyltransferase
MRLSNRPEPGAVADRRGTFAFPGLLLTQPRRLLICYLARGPRVNNVVELQTPRLRLRRLRQGDAPAVCAYRALPEVARFQSWELYGLADAEELIASQERTPVDTAGSWLQLGLTLAESGELVGDCGIHFPPGDDRQVELGITLSPEHQGSGLAAEVIECVLKYVFDALGKHRVWAVTDAENDAAARLFRRRGFRQEAHFVEHLWFKGRWGSEFVFALLRREWLERSASRRA